MTSDEFRKAMRRKPVVILPVGATEAHGSHLPLNTDSVQPEHVADELAGHIGCLVAPPIRYGLHSSTRNMPGTISLTFDTLRGLAYDILSSLVSNGADKIVVLSGHAGAMHMAALRLACERIVTETAARVMLLTDYDIAARLLPEAKEDGHGGLIETSRVMAITGRDLRTPKKKGRFTDKRFMIVRDPESCYPDGFVGEPGRATKEVGESINRRIVGALEQLIVENFGGAK